MGAFVREGLPDAIDYFHREGVQLKGPGIWKTGPCLFHGGSDSLRVETKSGRWVCMNCRVKGGDVLAYAMQRHGLDFVEAARSLGAYVEGDKPHRGTAKKTTLSALASLRLVQHEVGVIVATVLPIKDAIPDPIDRVRFIEAAAVVLRVMSEVAR